MLDCLGPAFDTVLNSYSGRESPDYNHFSSLNAAWLNVLVADFNKLPDTIPLGIYSIGHVGIATLPGEFTMVMGRRISDEIRQRLKGKIKNTQLEQQDGKKDADYEIVLIGLANEYLSYFTTPEEYQMQAYEGASTLYGAGAGEFVRFNLVELAKKLGNGPPIPEKEVIHKYHTGRIRHFGVDTIENKVNLADSGFIPVLLDKKTGLTDFRKLPAFCWSDRKVNLSSDSDINFRTTPRIRIMTGSSTAKESVTLTLSGVPEDDSGLDFVSMIASHSGDETQWCTVWFAPDEFKQDNKDFYFFVETTSGLQIESPKCFFEASGNVNPECSFKPDRYQ
jgi:hypothetical protein